MDELTAIRHRLAAAHAALRALPELGAGQTGRPDPETGEAWNRLNVLGHLAEMLPFWTAQVRAVLAGARETGRGEAGYAQRRQGVDQGPEEGEGELRVRIEASVAELARELAEMRPEDLRRPILHRTAHGERQADLGWLIQEMLVGHLEAHVKQLTDLT
jgi:hypothetical protein